MCNSALMQPKMIITMAGWLIIARNPPNVLPKVFTTDGVPRLCLMAIRDIKIGEQLYMIMGGRGRTYWFQIDIPGQGCSLISSSFGWRIFVERETHKRLMTQWRWWMVSTSPYIVLVNRGSFSPIHVRFSLWKGQDISRTYSTQKIHPRKGQVWGDLRGRKIKPKVQSAPLW